MPYIITAELCEALGLNPQEVVAHWVKPENCIPDLYHRLCRIIAETRALIVPEQEFEDYMKGKMPEEVM